MRQDINITDWDQMNLNPHAEELENLRRIVGEYNYFWEWYEDHFSHTKDELFDMFDKDQELLPDEYFNLNKV